MYTNARSLTSKRDELGAHAGLERPDVIAVTETWANDDHLMSEFSIPGYSLFHKNRVHKKGGGVICYIKNTLSAVQISKRDVEAYDTLYVEINANRNKKIIVAVVYRPPKQNAADDLALYEEIRTIIHSKDAVIMGDFNCPNIDWNSMAGDPEGARLVDLIDDEFLSQAVNQPTRENNVLDLVLATDPDLIDDCEVGEKLNGCDHHLLRFKINTEAEVNDNASLIPNYRRANFNQARALLSDDVWEQLDDTTIDTEWDTFKNKLIEVERQVVPMKSRRVNGSVDPPWMNREIKRAIALKRSSYETMKRTATEEARNMYFHNLRLCRNLIRTSKRNHEKRIARESKTNPKQFFTYIRAKKTVKSNVGPLTDDSGVITQDCKNMALILNKSFASVFTVETTASIPEIADTQSNREQLEIGVISEQEVRKYLEKLDPSKSTGPDDLSPMLFK